MSLSNTIQGEENFEELYRLLQEEGLRLADIMPPGMLMSRKVYAALLGEDSLDWVENINIKGTHYERNMEALYLTGLRISRRLGVADDFDEEVIEFREAYERNEKLVAYQMFKYGMKYQKMLDTQSIDDPDRIP